MSTPEKQRASGVSPFVDGVLMKRIQTAGVDLSLNREEITELANAGVVEYIADAPEVSITLESNNVGSTDLMALLSDAMITYTVDDEADGPRGGVGRYYIKSSSSNAAHRIITEDNVLDGYNTITITSNEDGTSAARTMWLNHCAITGFNLNYDVNGNVAENYTLSADNETMFLNDLGAVRCYKPVFNQIEYTSSGLGFVGLDSCVPDNSTVVAIGINNNILRNRNIGGVTGNCTIYGDRFENPGDGVASGMFYASAVGLSTPWASTAAGSSDRIWILYKPDGATWEAEGEADAGNPGFELESPSGALGAIRRGYISAYLWNTQGGEDTIGTETAAGRALRLQTIGIDISPGEEKLYELGTDGYYGIVKNIPVPVDVTITANDSDLKYYAIMTSTSHANTDVKSLTASDFNGYNKLRIKVYQDATKTTLLETVDIEKMYPSGDNWNVGVGGFATHEMTFTADNFRRVGSGTSVTGGSNIE